MSGKNIYKKRRKEEKMTKEEGMDKSSKSNRIKMKNWRTKDVGGNVDPLGVWNLLFTEKILKAIYR